MTVFEERFGKDFVDALYLMAEEENRKPIAAKFQNKRWWIAEQTERMKRRELDNKNVNDRELWEALTNAIHAMKAG